MSEAIRDLGGIENPIERRARRRVLAEPPAPAPAPVEKTPAEVVPQDTFLVRVRAPTVRAEDLCFIFEGRDVARVTDRAMAQVAGYMNEEHAGASWNMRSIERIPNVLREAPTTG
jgi:hypothetical protein